MRRAKIVATSDRVDTYVDVVAAIAATRDVDAIVLAFVGRLPDGALVSAVQRGLVALEDQDAYERGGRLKIDGEESETVAALLTDGVLVDVCSEARLYRETLRALGLRRILVLATAFAVAELVFSRTVPDKWINALSLLIGVGGLQLAYLSLKGSK